MQLVSLPPIIIKAARVLSNLNQEELGRLVCVSPSAIRYIETKPSYNTSAKTMAAIQKVFADNHITFDETENGIAIFYNPPKDK